jgi:hypothetical protein
LPAFNLSSFHKGEGMTSRNRIVALALALAISNLTFGSVGFGHRHSPLKQESRTVALGTNEATTLLHEAVTQARARPQTRDTAPTATQYSAQELEDLRGKFLELIETVKLFADLILYDNSELRGKLDQARTQFEQFTPQELNAVRATVDPATMNSRLAEARTVLEEYRPALERARDSKLQRLKSSESSGIITMDLGSFPGREGPDAVCDGLIGSGRPSAALIISTETVFLAAAIVRAVASRGCNQVLVVLGAGGNTSGVCIATDAIFFVAQALRDKVVACDLDWAKRTIDGNYQRLDHLHSDLETSIANDGANKSALTAEATANKLEIINNSDANKSAIITNSNANTNTITTAIGNSQTAVVNNANANLTTVTTAISNTQTAIINNDNANTAMLRDLLLRTQIEADLASTDGSTFVGLYITPTANGGYLELVRSIVVQTIANIGGSNAGQANAFLAKGDAHKAAGNYKEAYKNYRMAYQKAAG